ncbi:MAG: hypothetical protein R6V01_00705 [Thermoplasmatota archaeon]
MSGEREDLSDIRDRYNILKYLTEYNNLHPFVSMERAELVQELKIDKEALDKGIRYLEDRMLIETVWFMGGDYWTKVSQQGIDEILRVEREPEKPSEHFPSYYKLHYG